MPVKQIKQTRVCYFPASTYAEKFHHGVHFVGTYMGRRDPGAPDLAPDETGARADRFMLDNYIMWIEERFVYEIEPDPWEVI